VLGKNALFRPEKVDKTKAMGKKVLVLKSRRGRPTERGKRRKKVGFAQRGKRAEGGIDRGKTSKKRSR